MRWIPATVSSLGAPFASVATMTVEPDEPAARNAARRAANTAGSSPRTQRAEAADGDAHALAGRRPQGRLDRRAQVRLPQRIDRELQVHLAGAGRLALASSCAPVCSTERMLPAGSLNQAIGGPYSGLGGRRMPLLVVRHALVALEGHARRRELVHRGVDVLDRQVEHGERGRLWSSLG